MYSSNQYINKFFICLGFALLLLLFYPLVSVANDELPTKQRSFCLNITDFHSQKQLGWWALEDVYFEDAYFALSFIHSVSQTPVIDYYRLYNKNNMLHIVQIAERFEHHGAGLPSHVSEGSNWQHRNGYFWLTMQRPITQLIVRTDKDYNNRLHLDKRGKRDERGKRDKQFDPNNNEQSVSIDLNQWPDAALWIQPIICPDNIKNK